MGQHSGSTEGQTGPVPLPEQLGESTAHGAVRPESATLGHSQLHQTTTNSSSSTVSVEVAEQSVASSYYFNDQDTM